jgi:hypothetical protein
MIAKNFIVFCLLASLFTANGKSTAANTKSSSLSAVYIPTAILLNEASYLKQFWGECGRNDPMLRESLMGWATNSKTKLRHMIISV